MRAGVASAGITPELGVELGGYPYFDRASTGTHDDLVASALWLDDERGGSVLLVATDLFWITRPQADETRRRVARATGIDPDRVLITCSHTHSAPWMKAIFEPFPGMPEFVTRVDDAYIETVMTTCVEIAREALETAFTATLALGHARCGRDLGIGGNRRDPEHGPVADDVPVLTVRDASGTVRALWTKYALHPTILQGENTLVSADFPGAMRATVAEALPGAVFLYSMGAAGDQSPRYFRSGQTFDEVARFGRTLGQAVVSAAASAVALEPVLSVGTVDVALPVKQYPDVAGLQRTVEQRCEHEAALVAAGAGYRERQTANLWRLGAECDYHNALQERDGRLERRYDECSPYSVHALTIGDAAWVFFPGEVFVEFGLATSRRSPYPHTAVVTLTNGDLPGYCVTREALAEGGYEPGNSILAAESGDLLIEAAVGLLHDLSGRR